MIYVRSITSLGNLLLLLKALALKTVEELKVNELEKSKSVCSGTSPLLVNLISLFVFRLRSTFTLLEYQPEGVVIIGFGYIPS